MMVVVVAAVYFTVAVVVGVILRYPIALEPLFNIPSPPVENSNADCGSEVDGNVVVE